MNEHARKIWHAWVDGKEVQTKQQEPGEWITCSPIGVMPEMMPHRVPDRWRIKPETRSERRQFRVYLNKETNLAEIYHFTPYCSSIQTHLNSTQFERSEKFGGWITGKLPYTVKVEE